MNIFLSWSGDRSKHIAETLKKCLPLFIQSVKPWMSSSDIDKGARWSTDIAAKLSECKIGIICLTPENIEAPWILFEAGALSKTLDKTHVCPVLFDIEPSDLKGPLVQFQTTKLVEDDFKKLIATINNCQVSVIPDAQLDEIFNAWWPKVESELNKMSQIKKEISPRRKDRELLEEILALVRQQSRQTISTNQFRLNKDIALSLLSRLPGIEYNPAESSKIRVHELAQKMSIDSNELISKLKMLGVSVNNHMSVIEDDIVDKLMIHTLD